MDSGRASFQAQQADSLTEAAEEDRIWDELQAKKHCSKGAQSESPSANLYVPNLVWSATQRQAVPQGKQGRGTMSIHWALLNRQSKCIKQERNSLLHSPHSTVSWTSALDMSLSNGHADWGEKGRLSYSRMPPLGMVRCPFSNAWKGGYYIHTGSNHHFSNSLHIAFKAPICFKLGERHLAIPFSIGFICGDKHLCWLSPAVHFQMKIGFGF